MRFYQMISRNNDINGNPYRLIMVYKTKKKVYYRGSSNKITQEPMLVEAYEARDSSPNICSRLHDDGIFAIRSVHVSPSEYNSMKRGCKNFTGVKFYKAD